LAIDDATLYKALHRLEELGAIDSAWGISENKRRAKYYRLTPAGRRQLREAHAAWKTFSLAVGRVLRTS
jgi:DNA-binding PadR family transcriptional regulator